MMSLPCQSAYPLRRGLCGIPSLRRGFCGIPSLRRGFCGILSFRRGFCAVLSLLLALSCVPRAAALPGDPPVVDDGVAPLCDEAYYATTDYYGNLTQGSVVKSYILNGASYLTDAGDYDEVVNLTDGSAPVRGNGTVTFTFPDGTPSHFYFEGKTTAPFRNLPWHIAVHYTLNGVAAKAEDLAGKTGVVEILVDAVPNPEASEYTRNNYVLACNAIFNQEDILSLDAPGAQLQLIGNLRAALFLAFPGEEQHFVMRVGTDSFTFGGLTLMLVPATLSQLEEIAKLSEKKEDLEDSYHKLSDSLDTMLDAFQDMQGSLYETADGLDALDKARQTISQGKNSVYDELDRMQGDLGRIATAMDPVANLAAEASASLTESKNAANTLVDTTLGLRGDLERTETNLSGLRENLSGAEGSLERLEEDLEALEWNLEDLETVLSRTGETLDAGDGDLSDLRKKLEGVDDALSNLEGRLNETADALETIQDDGEDVDYGDELMDNLESLQGSLSRLRTALTNTRVPTYSASSSRSDNLAQVIEAGEQLERLYALTEAQAGQKAAFFTAMLTQQGYEAEQAAQIGALLAMDSPEALSAADPEGTLGLAAAYQTLSALYAMDNFPAFFQAILIQQGYDKSDAAQAARLWRIYEDNDRSLAALELMMETADDVEGSLGAASSAASTAMRNLSAPSARVLEDLSALCENLSDLRPMLEDADDLADGLRETLDALADLSGRLRDASGSLERSTETLQDAVEIGQDTVGLGEDTSANLRFTSADVREMSGTARAASETVRNLLEVLEGTTVRAREMLEDTDALRVTLNGFENTAQKSLKTLGNLSDSAAAAVRDANRVITATENLSKPAGRQLDEGAKQSLDGLTAALRTAADGLDTTDDVRSAKDAVTSLIEDTWDEYTGDVNNLLLMDAEAETESLTSSRNPAPQSVQVLIRTQEIKEDEDDGDGGSGNGNSSGNSGGSISDSGKPATFLGRVGQMFRDLWNSLTGIFR